MSEENKNEPISISKETKNIKVTLDLSKREQELTAKVEQQAQQIGALMASNKKNMTEEFTEQIDRKPPPKGGETAPLEPYWDGGNYQVERDELIPRHVSSDNVEDLYKYIDNLNKSGNREAHDFLTKQAEKILKSGKTFEYQGNHANFERLENGSVVPASRKKTWKVVNGDE
jgi:hypothetical protein